MKRKCPHCGAATTENAERVTCVWCGTSVDLTCGSEPEVPIGPGGDRNNGAVVVSRAIASAGSSGTKPVPNLVMLQVGGAFLFSGLWQIGNVALFIWAGERFRNVSDFGIVVIQFSPYVAVLAAMAMILCCAHRISGLTYREIFEVFALAIAYGLTIWIFIFNVLRHLGSPEVWEVFLALIQILAGVFLVFLATG